MNESLVASAVDQMLQRICGEYMEMPGLRLTSAQARRLWGLDEQTCEQLLESLTEGGFLYRSGNGTYARRSEGAAFPPVRMAKAGLSGASSLPDRPAVASHKG